MAYAPEFSGTMSRSSGKAKGVPSYCSASCGKDEGYHSSAAACGGDNPKSSERPRSSSKESFVWGLTGGKPA